jgi:hypothetical protein
VLFPTDSDNGLGLEDNVSAHFSPEAIRFYNSSCSIPRTEARYAASHWEKIWLATQCLRHKALPGSFSQTPGAFIVDLRGMFRSS